MAQEELLRRIEERLAAVKLSERKALLKADIGLDFIRDIRRRGHSPAAAKLARLAQVLGVPPGYLYQAVEETAPQPRLQPNEALVDLYVKGFVQAGMYREAIEWPPVDWFTIRVPRNDRFPGAEQFGLEVRGSSMDRLFPAGTIVVVVRYMDIGRLPVNGERVIAMRRTPGSTELEATIKEYEVTPAGLHVLWPRSTDPEFQQPFVLAKPEVEISDEFGGDLIPAQSAWLEADGFEVQIGALVIGSYRPEPVLA